MESGRGQKKLLVLLLCRTTDLQALVVTRVHCTDTKGEEEKWAWLRVQKLSANDLHQSTIIQKQFDK